MSETKRGTCRQCGEELALTKAGRIWTHKRESGGPTCGGSGGEPDPTPEDQKVICKECGESVGIRDDGLLREHGLPPFGCPGGKKDAAQRPQGVCRVCKGTFALTSAGAVELHLTWFPNPDWSDGSGCNGGGRLPLGEVSTQPPRVTEADDVLMQAPQVQTGPKRDRYGRYLLPHPETGKAQPWVRATTFAGSVEDTYNLSMWSQRLLLKGAGLRPDLASLASTLDVKEDRDRLNKLAESAKEAAGSGAAANLGTVIHKHTENVDAGAPLESVPGAHRADVAAYRAAMESAGIEVFPHLIERITAVPQFGVAGTFDRVVRLPDGTYCVADVKSGKSLDYGWHKIAIQIALYAHGVNEAGLWDPVAEQWEQGPEVRTDFGIVMHLPVGQATCTLYKVDLTEGWGAAALCHMVRTWRSKKKLAEVFWEQSATAPTEPIWEERFASASSRGELASLFDRARSASLDGGRLGSLTELGMRRLAFLEESAG